ncbi:MAG: ABC transporter ATP-binding protein [Thermotogae bacterium]|nr:MAG: ABC transporter ATP-binding protein [Thermotogota bacterium]
MSLLKIRNLAVSYNGIPALKKVSFEINKGEVVSVLGPNGAGKTTLLRAISGLVKCEKESEILYKGKNIVGLQAYKIARMGIAHVPEGRQVFPDLSVQENLEVASVLTSLNRRSGKIQKVYELFQELNSRKNQPAGTLSGGEQQMLAIGRALVSDSELIMVDEPSMGLAPVIISRIFKTLRQIVQEQNLTLLLVEQNAKLSLPLSDRIYVLSQGRIVLSGTVDEVKDSDLIRQMYFARE